MATIIDKFIIELGLDPTNLSQGQNETIERFRKMKEHAEADGKSIEKSTKGIADGFNGVIRAVGALSAGYLTASSISSFVQNTNQTNTAVGQLGTTLGITIEKLSQYRQAAKLAGVSPESMIQTIQSSTNNLNAAASGQLGGNFWSSYAKLGVQGQLLGPDGKPVPVEDYLRRVQHAVRRTQASGNYTQGQITGFLADLGINQETAFLMERTDNSLEKYLKTSERMGVENKGNFENSQKLKESWGQLGTAVDNLGRAFADDLNPGLTTTVKMLQTIVEYFQEHKKIFEVIAGIVAGASVGGLIGSVVPGVGTAAGVIAGGAAGGYTAYTLPDNAPKGGAGGAQGTSGGAGGAAGASGGAAGVGSLSNIRSNDYLKQQRQSRIDEINADPVLKENVLKMLQSEEGSVSGKVGAMEVLLNRSNMIGNSIKQELFSGFYGPINRGVLNQPLGARARATSETAFNAAANGSNLIEGRTDQGMVTDPNGRGPGRIRVPGTTGVFNFWQGKRGGRYFSHADSAAFAEEQNRKANASGGGGAWGPFPPASNPWLSAPSPVTGAGDQSSHTQNHSEIKFGEINIHTAARDAGEVATGLEEHMRSRFRTLQSTTGLA